MTEPPKPPPSQVDAMISRLVALSACVAYAACADRPRPSVRGSKNLTENSKSGKKASNANTARANPPPRIPPKPPSNPPSFPLPASAHRCAQRIRSTLLSYKPGLTRSQRLADFFAKTRKALSMMGLNDIRSIRQRAVRTLKRAGKPWTWMAFLHLRTKGGDPAAVKLTIRVWVPKNARRLRAYHGSNARWKALKPHLNLPHESGNVWFCEKLADVNDKKRYKAATLSFYTYALHAPVAFLLFDHVFREGWFEVNRRIPIMSVRSGEDCFSADRTQGAVTAESASFKAKLGPDHNFTVFRTAYFNYGEILGNCHVRRSNHRIGCAMDVNLFWFLRSVGGTTNPITSSRRQFQRDKMHAIDARQLPQWFYDAAGRAGYRIPQEWTYPGGRKDWTHIDVKKARRR